MSLKLEYEKNHKFVGYLSFKHTNYLLEQKYFIGLLPY